ncbi:MAG: bifunctional methylenetetrahydrofolate dehydrogenase/methenyltetrahydrofolate cyclohydrolase FolD [Pseudomonadota bacterium]
MIDGKSIASELRASVAVAVAALPKPPGLAVVLVGEDPASQVYVRNKVRQSEAAGMRSILRALPADASQSAVEALIDHLNADPEIDGILLQLPLPDGLDADALIERISPEKDVDGLTEVSAGRLILGKPGLRPCTPFGCVILAKNALGEDLSGKSVVVVGRSILVGKPAALLFLAENATVTIAHSRTADLPALCRSADILVAAVGRPAMVGADWIKPGAAVIDVGINRVQTESGSKLVGDVDFAAASTIAGAITPVPGGVGPMTIACLLRNTVLAACARRGWTSPSVLAQA